MTANSKTPLWECFNDPGYFDLWAVRRKDQRKFEEAIHVRTKEEAMFLVASLNELEELRRYKKTHDQHLPKAKP